MSKKDMFNKIFQEVAKETGCSYWWQLADSDDFDEVEKRISEKLGYDCHKCPEFKEWYADMVDDL